MAEATEKKITEVQALRLAMEVIEPEGQYSIYSGEELIAKLAKMVETREKKREKKGDDTKTLANLERGEKFQANWQGEEFRASDVAMLLDVNSSQASQVCRAMVKADKWVVVPSIESVKVYKFN